MRRTKKRITALALCAATLTLGIAAGPAAASVTECPSGSVCGWAYTSYSDLRWDDEFDKPWLAFTEDNVADSVASHGNLDCVWFYTTTNYTGDSIRFNRPGLGGIYRDPNLSNGGGATGDTTLNWANKISSFDLYRC